MRSLLVSVLRQTFLKEAGKFQGRQERPKAFLVSFSLSLVDYDKEEGYRQLDLLLYAPANYVQVWKRERWTVIPQEGLDCDDDGESFVKDGYDYDKGASAWEMIGDHDSCYPDAVARCLAEYERRILGFDGPGDWFRVIDPPEEIAG